MSLKVQVVPVTPYQQNCSIVQCEATGLAAIVDPGGDIERIEAAIAKMGATVEKVLLTHGHLDHCAAADILRQKLSVPMEGPEQGDRFWIDKLPEWCEMAGFPRAEPFTRRIVGLRMAIRLPLASRLLRLFIVRGTPPATWFFCTARPSSPGWAM